MARPASRGSGSTAPRRVFRCRRWTTPSRQSMSSRQRLATSPGRKPKNGQGQHDRTVPKPVWPAGLQQSEHLLQLVITQEPGKGRQPPAGDDRDRRLKRLVAQRRDAQVTEERPQRRAHGPHRRGRQPLAHRSDELRHMSAAKNRGVNRVVPERRPDEQAHVPLIAAQGPLAQPPGPSLVFLVRLDQHIEGPQVSWHGMLLSEPARAPETTSGLCAVPNPVSEPSTAPPSTPWSAPESLEAAMSANL